MQIKNKKDFFKFLLITVSSVFLVALIVKATTTIGTNISTAGTLSVSGNATSSGFLVIGTTNPKNNMAAGDLLIGNQATSSVSLWLGAGGTANNIDLTGGDLFVQGDAEIDGNLYLGRVTSTSATTTSYLMVGSKFTVPSTFDYSGDLAVSSDIVVAGTASTTNAVFSGKATTTGNMVIGSNNQATSGATTTVTMGSYNGGGAGNGVCLKFRQGGAWIYCVPSLAGITCSATTCE